MNWITPLAPNHDQSWRETYSRPNVLICVFLERNSRRESTSLKLESKFGFKIAEQNGENVKSTSR